METKITEEKLEELGFIKQEIKGKEVYYKGDYGLKYELENWLIIGKHSGQEITAMQVIETLHELEKHYLETTGENLVEN